MPPSDPPAQSVTWRTLWGHVCRFMPGKRTLDVIRRVAVGCWNDGMIHAGNLAYVSLLAIFPFFVTAAAFSSLLGDQADRLAAVRAVLSATPPIVTAVLEPVARQVIEARSGWLLWAGAIVGLWTVGSLIETLRDILRRAYDVGPGASFWRYRLITTGIIIVAVAVLLLSLFAQLMIGAAQEVIGAWFPQLTDALSRLAWSRIIAGLGLFGSIYLLFLSLTPSRFRRRGFPKWPGALLVTVWWIGVTASLPWVISQLFAYDLTYGSLAGIMIALFFFWLVGLGMVAGAELNAALAATAMPTDGTQENVE